MKGEIDLLELCKSNASVCYPHYPPSSIQVTVSSRSVRSSTVFYVALFVLIADPLSGIPAPRLLETGPPKLNLDSAIIAMLESNLARRISKVVNEQASQSNRVQLGESEQSGYRFVWPEDLHGTALTLAPTTSSSSRAHSPRPPSAAPVVPSFLSDDLAPPTYEEARQSHTAG